MTEDEGFFLALQRIEAKLDQIINWQEQTMGPQMQALAAAVTQLLAAVNAALPAIQAGTADEATAATLLASVQTTETALQNAVTPPAPAPATP